MFGKKDGVDIGTCSARTMDGDDERDCLKPGLTTVRVCLPCRE